MLGAIRVHNGSTNMPKHDHAKKKTRSPIDQKLAETQSRLEDAILHIMVIGECLRQRATVETLAWSGCQRDYESIGVANVRWLEEELGLVSAALKSLPRTPEVLGAMVAVNCIQQTLAMEKVRNVGGSISFRLDTPEKRRIALDDAWHRCDSVLAISCETLQFLKDDGSVEQKPPNWSPFIQKKIWVKIFDVSKFQTISERVKRHRIRFEEDSTNSKSVRYDVDAFDPNSRQRYDAYLANKNEKHDGGHDKPTGK